MQHHLTSAAVAEVETHSAVPVAVDTHHTRPLPSPAEYQAVACPSQAHSSAHHIQRYEAVVLRAVLLQKAEPAVANGCTVAAACRWVVA